MKNETTPNRTLYAIMGLMLAILLIGSGAFLWLSRSGGNNLVGIGGPFTLENGDGQPVTNKDFLGKYMLVYFGYTFCPDVCPTTLAAITDAMDKLGPESKQIQPVFISVDPARDTPAVVKRYAAAFGPYIVGLTGTPAEVAQAAKEYRVYYKAHRPKPGETNYTVDHSSVIYLMDPKGEFVAPIPAEETGAQIAARLKQLVR